MRGDAVSLDPGSQARALIVSQRRRQPTMARSLRYEFEDLVSALDRVELVAPGPASRRWHRIHQASAVLERVSPGASALLSPSALGSPRHELVLVDIQTTWDLLPLEPLAAFLRRGRIRACIVDEVFSHRLHERAGELRLLSQFDLLFSTLEWVVDTLAEATGRPAEFLPPSVDALGLCPFPSGPPRKIDVLAVGRQPPETHQALLEEAERRGWLYLYDREGGDSRAPDHQAHRRRVSDLLRRSRYFLCYPGKIDRPDETGGKEEFGFRYFEGMGAGTLLLGQRPATPSAERLAGWPDAVVPLPFGGREISRWLDALEQNPARQEEVRRRNVLEALGHHDHVHRWGRILAAAGLGESAPMAARRAELGRRMELVRATRGPEEVTPVPASG